MNWFLYDRDLCHEKINGVYANKNISLYNPNFHDFHINALFIS